MNERLFFAKYSPLGIDLQALTNQTDLQTISGDAESENTYISDISLETDEPLLPDCLDMTIINDVAVASPVENI